MCCKCENVLEGDQMPCTDCGDDTGQRGLKEWYMVRPSTWKEAAKNGEILCVGCLEERLGRYLIPWDFSGYSINDLEEFQRSQRLRNRIHGY